MKSDNTDNTIKRSTEQESFTKEGLLTLIDSLPIAVVVINQHSCVALANKASIMFIGRKSEDIIGLIGGEAFRCSHHKDAPEGCGYGPACKTCGLRQTVTRSLADKVPQSRVQTKMNFLHHGERVLLVSTVPLTLDANDVVMLSLEDITELKKQEQIQIEKEKLTAIIETSRAVCHELNQPLMIISGLAELFLYDEIEVEPTSENIKEIKTQVDRMAAITKKLMNVTTYKTKPFLNTNILDLDQAVLGHGVL